MTAILAIIDKAYDPAADFIVFKSVALAPDHTGRYRVRYSAGTDLCGQWTDAAAADYLRNSHIRDFPNRFERCDRNRWEQARAGSLNGYSDVSDIEAPYDVAPWQLAI